MNEANFISMLLFDSLNWLADVASYFPSGCFCTMRPNTFSLSPTSFISSKKILEQGVEALWTLHTL